MTKLTQRLIDLTYARDPGIQCLREFLGTVNGVDVVGCDVQGMYDITSEDATHTWHEHLSILRQFADDLAAMDALADAIIGGHTPPPTQQEDYVYELVRNVDAGNTIYQHGDGYLAYVPDPARLGALQGSWLCARAGQTRDIGQAEYDALAAAVITANDNASTHPGQ